MQFRAALSFRGRIGRKRFWLLWLGAIGFLILALALNGVLLAIGRTASLLGLPVVYALLGLAAWLSLATQVKRWHDLDRSGWMVLITFVPFIGFLVSVICLGCLRGSLGENHHGRPDDGDPFKLAPGAAAASQTSAARA